jgi:acyl transferase domain-containing protein
MKFIPLNANGAFHSHYMKPAATEFKKYIHQFTFSPLAIDVISNVQAKPYTQEEIKENLVDQITHSVKWSESIRHMMKLGVTEFKELGAGHVLTTLIEKIQAHTRTADKNIDTVVDMALDMESTEVNLSSDNKPAIEDAIKIVTAWNNAWPVGTRVSCKNHGEILKTRTQAILLFDQKATIYMQGYKGYFDLADVQPVSEKKMSVDS